MTRRDLLCALPFSSTAFAFQTKQYQAPAGKGRNKLPPTLGEFVAMVDPVTENLVIRLTNPTYTSINPPPQNHHVSSKSRFLLYGSDRGGALCPYHLDLKTAAARQLADTKAFRPDTLAMDREERNAFFVDGEALQQVSLGNLKARTLAEDVSDFHMNGSGGTMVVLRGGKLERLSGDRGTVLADNVSTRGIVSPAGNNVCFARDGGTPGTTLWRVAAEGGSPVLMAQGAVSCPFWNLDSESLLFLRQMQGDRGTMTLLREVSLDGRDEGTVAPTSQFISFAPNADGTVFIGASRSKAQPNVVLMLRSVRREMTLCEHHSSQPDMVRPVFSPNSRRVYFASDRHGKPALYVVNVELLVEPTEGS
jgi:oligogalacturonide lyase